MYLRAIPEGAQNCGSGCFTLNGATSAAAAHVIVRMATTYCEEQAHAVIIRHLESDPTLLDAASQMKEMKTGYTIDGVPTEVQPGSWQIPFTAYIFDMADASNS